MKSIDIKLGEQILTVIGEYDKGESEGRHNPPIASSFDISAIHYKGVDVTDLVMELSKDLTTIEEKTINQIED